MPDGPETTQSLDEIFNGETSEVLVDNTNLAHDVPEERLKEIGADVVRAFDADCGTRTDLDADCKKWTKMLACYREPKTTPHDNCSNVDLPFLPTAIFQLAARGEKALFSKDIVKCWSPAGDHDAAKRDSQYMNYQLRHEMTDWLLDMRKMLIQVARDGSAFKKTYPNTERRQPESRLLGLDEFVVSYGTKSLSSPFTRKSHIVSLFLNEIKQRMRSADKIFREYDDFNPKTGIAGVSRTRVGHMSGTKEAQDKITKQQEPITEYLETRPIIEVHTYLDLNYEPSRTGKGTYRKKSDGVERPFIVTVDYDTQKVLRLTSRMGWDPDHDRFEPVEYFTHYGLIPNPESIYSFGFGQLTFRMAETATTALNQIIDAGHLNNLQSGFFSKRSGLKAGDFQFQMGQFKGVDVGGQDIKNAIMALPFKPPDRILYMCIGLLHDYVKEVTSTAEFMGGTMPPSDTAATTVLAIIEQGLMVYSSIQAGWHTSLGEELKKIFCINRDVLDEKVAGLILNTRGPETKTFESFRKDFSSKVRVLPNSDPNIASDAQKLIKAQQVLNEAKTNPIMQNPKSLYEATKDYFEALGVDDIEQLVQEPPPPSPPPDLPPEEENAKFIQGQDSQVLPQQNHKAHFMAHVAFANTPHFKEGMDPHSKSLHEQHIKNHVAEDYKQEEAKKRHLEDLHAKAMMDMMGPERTQNAGA